ncbi:MAG: sigma-70 family RNA polymerase sigma factor [Gemmatimonadales bacterium]
MTEPAAVPGGGEAAAFHDRFVALFDAHFPRLYRYLDRLSGDPDLAADLAQEAFVRLYRRGSLPDAPVPWLVSVTMNLFRNSRTTGRRRRLLLTPSRARAAHGDPPASPEESVLAAETRRRVRTAIDRMPERDRQLLLLRAEGLSYRELALAVGIHEASVGTLLARARAAFRRLYEVPPE